MVSDNALYIIFTYFLKEISKSPGEQSVIKEIKHKL